MKTHPTLLVTGASGNLGRQVVEFLLGSSPGTIIAGTRDLEKIADLTAQGVETRQVDFNHPEKLASAFAGVDRLLLISTDSLDQPGKRIAQHKAAIEAAVSAGVRHLIYTSVTAASAHSAALVTPDHHATEQAIIASGIGYTILRNALYIDNLSGALPQMISSGKWYHAAGDGKIAYITRQDCARVAAAALSAGFQGERILEISGPELLDHDQTAAVISELSGTPVAAVPIDGESLVSAITGAGLPEAIARVLVSFDTAQAAGEFDVLSSAVLDLTGREPESIRNHLAGRFPIPSAAES